MAQFILKDSKGKEQTFDHETIYVRDTNGELVQFTQGDGDIPAVVQPLEVTENGTYTAPDGVDGYSPVTVNVPAPEIVLQDKTITENGEYTADEGFDGLGKVTVDVAGSGGSVRYYKNSVTLTGTNNVKVSVDFGFTPDFICIFPVNSSPVNKNGVFIGISTNLAQICNVSKFTARLMSGSSSLNTTTYGASIDASSGSSVYGVSETGFYIGANHQAGSYYVVAIGI